MSFLKCNWGKYACVVGFKCLYSQSERPSTTKWFNVNSHGCKSVDYSSLLTNTLCSERMQYTSAITLHIHCAMFKQQRLLGPIFVFLSVHAYWRETFAKKKDVALQRLYEFPN